MLWCPVIKDVTYIDVLSKICLLKKIKRVSCTKWKTLTESDASLFHMYCVTHGESNKKWPWHTATPSFSTKMRTCRELIFKNTIFASFAKVYIFKLYIHGHKTLISTFAKVAFYMKKHACILILEADGTSAMLKREQIASAFSVELGSCSPGLFFQNPAPKQPWDPSETAQKEVWAENSKGSCIFLGQPSIWLTVAC